MVTDNLITTWLEVETREPGRTMADALRDMNKALKRQYQQSKLRKWERGELLPDNLAIDYMLSRIAPVLLLDEGLSKAKASRIAAKLALPRRG